MAKFVYEKTKDFTIMSNHHLRDRRLSFKAVGLLSFMLSVPSNWDWTIAGLVAIRKDGKESISSAMKELEQYGYLERIEVRDEKGRFMDIEYNIYEIPKAVETVDNATETVKKPEIFDEPKAAKPVSGEPKTEKPPTEKPTPENPAQIKNQSKSKTNVRKTNVKNTDVTKNQSIESTPELTEKDESDGIDEINILQCEEKIRENIEYSRLCIQYGKARTNEIMELMLGIMYSTKKTVRISGGDYPAEYIKSRIMKLNYKNIEYVFDSMDKTTTKINNIHAYLKTALLNALSTTDSYYRAEVNYDMEDFWEKAAAWEAAKQGEQK